MTPLEKKKICKGCRKPFGRMQSRHSVPRFVPARKGIKAGEYHAACCPLCHRPVYVAAPEMYEALDQAPEMDAWPDMTRRELEQSLEGYVRWFNETAMPALRKARGEK